MGDPPLGHMGESLKYTSKGWISVRHYKSFDGRFKGPPLNCFVFFLIKGQHAKDKIQIINYLSSSQCDPPLATSTASRGATKRHDNKLFFSICYSEWIHKINNSECLGQLAPWTILLYCTLCYKAKVIFT